ncbi:hypothetical protein [Streptomyces catenulae]|uniref:Uncharacterized protein n=1 Tax=Streptomyces catenulae TaxID=66875 RepID=A0ABV2Z8T2_9ACTN|nr:hypothetical protein [Streptomyces catenulae]
MSTAGTAPRAGTVSNDVMTVHELTDDADPRPKCGAGDGERVTEWLRAVNCPDCLAT